MREDVKHLLLLASLSPRLKGQYQTQNHKQPKQGRAHKQRRRRLYIRIASHQHAQNAADPVEDNTKAIARRTMRRRQYLGRVRINRAIVNVSTKNISPCPSHNS